MLKLLDAFPLLLLIIIAFGLFVIVTGSADVASALTSPLFGIPIISGDELAFATGDLFILLAIILLFIEVLKSTQTGTISLMNHGFSTAVMVISIILLLVAKGFGNTTFLFLTLMTVFDVVAGFVITTISARRDIGFGIQ